MEEEFFKTTDKSRGLTEEDSLKVNTFKPFGDAAGASPDGHHACGMVRILKEVQSACEILSHALSLTTAMENECRQMLCYIASLGIAPEEYAAEFLARYEDEELPLTKAVGKKAYAEFTGMVKRRRIEL